MGQLIKPQIKWTEEKIQLLKKEYPLGDKKELAKKLGIKYQTLKAAARTFKVKSLQDKNFYKLKFLYEDHPLACYWMGFIMADGNILQNGQLRVTLSIKDKIHLQKLATLLKINLLEYKFLNNYNNKLLDYCFVTCNDAKYGKLLLQKYQISDKPKTYNPPPNINIKDDKLFLSYLLGMIDGDGAFSKEKNGNCQFIRIELHGSWIKILEETKNRLNKIGMQGVVTGINNRGYSFIKIYRHQCFKFLKNFGIINGLPLLERKWSSVDLERDTIKNFKETILNTDLLIKWQHREPGVVSDIK